MLMSKICIGVPNGGTVKAKTAYTLMSIKSEHELFPVFSTGSYIAENRERIVDIAISQMCSHLFFVDADMSFPSDTLNKLLDLDKDIVGGMYNYRKLPLQTTVKFIGKDGTSVEGEVPREPFKVAAIGAGCLLIKMNVFSQLKKPCFQVEQIESGEIVCTTDVAFCEKAKDAGYDIWCDPSLAVKHIGDHEF